VFDWFSYKNYENEALTPGFVLSVIDLLERQRKRKRNEKEHELFEGLTY
jgi:hypothetical protein